MNVIVIVIPRDIRVNLYFTKHALEEAHFLLGENADINAHDEQNNTPLHVAALGGQQEVVLVLLNELILHHFMMQH